MKNAIREVMAFEVALAVADALNGVTRFTAAGAPPSC